MVRAIDRYVAREDLLYHERIRDFKYNKKINRADALAKKLYVQKK